MQSSDKRLGQLHKARREYESLLKSAGWKRLCAVMTEQVRARRMMAGTRQVQSFDDVFLCAQNINEAGGLALAKALPEHLLADIAADIAALEAEQLLEHENAR